MVHIIQKHIVLNKNILLKKNKTKKYPTLSHQKVLEQQDQQGASEPKWSAIYLFTHLGSVQKSEDMFHTALRIAGFGSSLPEKCI